MNYLSEIDTMRKIAHYLTDKDLYRLMMTCKTLRDLIGTSDIWKNLYEIMELHKLDNLVNGVELFKIFISITLSVRNFALREYYGNWYYLYVLHDWIDFRTIWNIKVLFQKSKDIEKLYTISCLVRAHKIADVYHEWERIIPRLYHEMSKIQHADKDKILNLMYLDSDNGSQYYQMFVMITDQKMSYFYPLEGEDIYPFDLQNEIRIYYGFYFNLSKPILEVTDLHTDESYECHGKNFNDLMERISKEIDVASDVLSRVVLTALGRGYLNYDQMRQNVIGFE